MRLEHLIRQPSAATFPHWGRLFVRPESPSSFPDKHCFCGHKSDKYIVLVELFFWKLKYLVIEGLESYVIILLNRFKIIMRDDTKMDIKKVGNQIAELRKLKGLTQSELGERLCVSFQAVSKWERGESLPDTAILPDLANVLETTTDFILTGGERMIEYKGKIMVSDMIQGLRCLENMGNLLGNSNIIYRSAINGIDTNMNTEIEKAFTDDYVFEAF